MSNLDADTDEIDKGYNRKQRQTVNAIIFFVETKINSLKQNEFQ